MKTKISDFKHHYIDEYGNVFNDKTKKFLKAYKGKNGYMMVDIWEDNKANKRYIHRLLGETFIPNPLNKRTINHIDGIKTNNSLDNLEWATDSENVKHAYDHNLNYSTTKNKLTNKDWQIIWNRFLNHENLSTLCKEYNISLTTISMWLNKYVRDNNLEKQFEEEKQYQKRKRIEIRDFSSLKHTVWMCDKITHQKIKKFNSLYDATKFLNVSSSGPISNVIADRQKSAFGYWWSKA